MDESDGGAADTQLSSISSSSAVVRIYNSLDQGCLSYERSWAWQQVLLSRRLEQRRRSPQASTTEEGEDHDCVLFLEHAPVYTLGRGADEAHLTFLQAKDKCENGGGNGETQEEIERMRQKLSRKARGPGTARLSVDRRMENQIVDLLSVQDAMDRLAELACPVEAPNGVPIFRVERGGEVTFHGPSQLVVYPMFDLKRAPFRADLHWYLRMVEEVVIRTLAHYDIHGSRDEINTGVWVDSNKVAAVGISSSRWITTHGFALNIDPDLSFFDTDIILPCGIQGRGVTSMAQILRERGFSQMPTINQVASVVISKMEEVFAVQLQEYA